MTAPSIIGQGQRRARIGSCITDFWWTGAGIEVRWDPAPPRRLKAGQLAKYRAERNAFVQLPRAGILHRALLTSHRAGL